MAENSMTTVLMITVLGMGLLFLALVFFYGLLSGMAGVLKDRAVPPRQEAALAPEGAGEEAAARWQAAAVAVALARAELQAPLPGSSTLQAEGQGGSHTTSAWWSLHHQRRLASGACRRRSR